MLIAFLGSEGFGSMNAVSIVAIIMRRTAFVLILLLAPIANAQIDTEFSASIDGSLEFSRPNFALTAVEVGNFAYQERSFIPAGNGVFNVSVSVQSFDSAIFVYENSFDPTDPLNNLIGGDDDSGGSLRPLVSNLNLTQGTTYIVVATAFGAGSTGTVTFQVSGPFGAQVIAIGNVNKSPEEITAPQLQSLANQVGAGQFSTVNPLTGPQVAGFQGAGGAGATGTPTPPGGRTGTPGTEGSPGEIEDRPENDQSINFIGNVDSILAALATYHDVAIYNNSGSTDLSDVSYQYHTGDSFGGDPTNLRSSADAIAPGSVMRFDPNSYIQLPFGITGDFRVWAYGSFTTFQNNRLNSEEDLRQNGDAVAVNVGGDVRVGKDLIVGVSVGLSQAEVDLTFTDGEYEEHMISVSPYAVYNMLDGRVRVGLTGGFGLGTAEIATAANASAEETDTNMVFTSAELTGGDHVLGTPLSLQGTVNYTFLQKELGTFLDSAGNQNPVTIATSHDFTFGGEARYDFVFDSLTVQPFTAADLIWQAGDTINDDPLYGAVGGGLRVTDTDSGLAGQIEATQVIEREDFTQTTVEGSVSYSFRLGTQEQLTLAPYFGSQLGAETLGFGGGMTFGQGGILSGEMGFSQTRTLGDSSNESDPVSSVEVNATINF